MMTEKSPQTIDYTDNGYICSWTSFSSHNFGIVDPISKFLLFSESLERDLSNDVFKSKF